MIYMRGHAADYDGWAAAGCTGWGYEDVLPYFRKSEDQSRGEDRFHGVGGPLRVQDLKGRYELAEAYVAAGQQAGFRRNPDFNGETQEGIGYYQSTVKAGRRWSVAQAYLDPARRRANLRVETRAHVTRIELEGKRAVAVRYLSPAGEAVARCRREIVLCGGTFASPQVLMLSGIGPAGHLSAMGVSPAVDLPGVGANLHDHVYVQVMFRCTQPVTVNDLYHSRLRKLGAGLRYMLSRSGVLADSGFYAGLLMRSGEGAARPDVQINMTSWTAAARTEKGVIPHDFPGFSLTPVHLAPQGRGEVRLRSADPKDAPSIRFRFLTTPYERDALKAGVKAARLIVRQPALRPYFDSEIGASGAALDDAALDAWLTDAASSNYHPAGSCRMGNDDAAVVDPQLKVRGVDGLRVADASVMPQVVSGNTNAPTIMIAEKASDMMLAGAA